MASTLLYPMKYLIDWIVPYGPFLKAIFCQYQCHLSWIVFCFYKNYSYWFLLSQKIMLFPLNLILGGKKCKNCYVNN